MKKSNVLLSIFASALVCLLLSMASSSQGEIGPINKLGKIGASQEAGSEFFRGLSGIYLSLDLLEQGKLREANRELQKTKEVYFSRALKIYAKMSKAASTQPIILNNIPLEQLERIAANLKDFKGHFPNTLREIADIAVKEFANFVELIGATKFVNNANVNRQRVRELYERIFRLTTLGLATSDLISIVPRYQR